MSSFVMLPPFVKRVDVRTTDKINDMYHQLFNTIVQDGVKFPLPKDLKILAINDGFIHTREKFRTLQTLINEFANDRIFFFFPYASFNDVFTANFSFEVMNWIESEVFENPVIFFIPDTQFYLVIDEQLSITVIAFELRMKNIITKKLGGAKSMRKEFEKSLQQNYVGSGEVEKIWLEAFALKYCDW